MLTTVKFNDIIWKICRDKFMINRNSYIEKLVKWKDKKIIKVLTGMRRVGKSTILLLYKKHLLGNGASENQIIYLNLEDLENEYIDNYKKLYDEILKKIVKDKMNYIMIDEVQNIEKFEKAIDSLYIKENVDIYLTGSNAKFLSSEIATVLSGRYIELNILPLSFKEYISDEENGFAFPISFPLYSPQIAKEKLFNDYLKYGALPYIKVLNNDEESIQKYLENIYNTVYAKDILSHIDIRNYEALAKTSKFMFDNISNNTSVKKITDALNSAGNMISQPTIDTYIEALSNTFMFYKANRYDVKGKKILSTQYKYYAVDMGLRNFVLGNYNNDLGRILENIVYLELKNRGYDVSIGKVGEYEVDFVVKKTDEIIYFQVAQSLIDKNTYEREMRPLRLIKDNYPKYILSMDNILAGNDEGIKHMNIIDFLLGQD